MQSEKAFGLQTKLTINESGGAYEQEADRIADRMMAAPAHSDLSTSPPRIQRRAAQPAGQTEAAPASWTMPLPAQQAVGADAATGNGTALRPRLLQGAGAYRRGI
jgi:hypothetical protein